MIIKGVSCWCLVGLFQIIDAPCYVSSDENGTESAAWNIGQDVK
jgi:hypothetical protein